MSPNNITDYLDQLQLPDTTKAKIRSTLAFYQSHKLLEIDDIFVSQHKDADQNIRAVRFWMFDSNLCAEADITNGKISGDVAFIKSRISRYEITASDEEFSEADSSKYLKIEAVITSGLVCRLQAFGKNRQFLWDLFIKHIKPNVFT